jgi:hypothetical protein
VAPVIAAQSCSGLGSDQQACTRSIAVLACCSSASFMTTRSPSAAADEITDAVGLYLEWTGGYGRMQGWGLCECWGEQINSSMGKHLIAEPRAPRAAHSG